MSAEVRRARAEEIYESSLRHERATIDRLFLALLLLQWVGAIAVASPWSPYAWTASLAPGSQQLTLALYLGAAINVAPLMLVSRHPGRLATRLVVAIAQMLWSGLLIHLTGGRFETHFHVFGSLAFLAFYRDWRVVVAASAVVLGDHAARGWFWPQSLYGMPHAEPWRLVEQGFWVVFADTVLLFGCARGNRELRVLAAREAALEDVNTVIEDEVVAKTAALEASLDRYKQLVESTHAVPWEADAVSYRLTYISPQVQRLFGDRPESLVGRSFIDDLVCPEDRGRVLAKLESLVAGGVGMDCDVDYRVRTGDDRLAHVRSVMSVHQDAPTSGLVLRGVTFDITAQKKRGVEHQQAQKLESIGRLAAGVAHEINTPVQFVSDSVHFVRDAMSDVMVLLTRYQDLHRAVERGDGTAQAVEAVRQAEQDADLEYLTEHVPRALARSLEGLDRVATIVRSMKEFAHPDQKEMTAVDLNQAVQSTLVMARNEYKYVADVETDLGDVPHVKCHGGDVNQAVLNIIVNAAHAIGDTVKGTEQKGRIVLRTRRDGESVVIAIADTGGGIPDAIRERVFDPFFTTKDVGYGTGQGLAIARSVIVDKHGGDLTFETQPGHGTTFYLRLPIEGARSREAAA